MEKKRYEALEMDVAEFEIADVVIVSRNTQPGTQPLPEPVP